MEMNSGNISANISLKSKINWGAIFAGSFIAMFFQLLLGLLGLAIGLTALSPGEAVSARGISIATGIWLISITLISVFIGAFAAGRFAGLQAKYDGLMHGIATLAFLTILSISMVTSGVSNVIGGAFTFGLQAANLPQVQQAMQSDIKAQSQTTGAAASVQSISPQQKLAAKQQASKYASRGIWIAFITGLLSLIVAGLGGLLGMQSRVKQIINESAAA